MFRVDEIVAKVSYEGGAALAAVHAASEDRVTLRFSSEPPELGASMRLEITHRVAVNDAMTDVSVRVLGTVGRTRQDGRAWVVDLDVRAASPAAGLGRLSKHL